MNSVAEAGSSRNKRQNTATILKVVLTKERLVGTYTRAKVNIITRQRASVESAAATDFKPREDREEKEKAKIDKRDNLNPCVELRKREIDNKCK